MVLRCLFSLCLVWGLASSMPACVNTCDVTPGEPILHAGGFSEGGLYETGAWNADWLRFAPGTVYRFPHQLGTDRIVINVYTAFSPRPFEEQADPRGAAESAGNLAIYESVGDDYFELRNDTCADLYLRATAFAPSPLGEGGARD